jgi:hypothetical protein
MKIKKLGKIFLIFLLVSCSKDEVLIKVPPLSFSLRGSVDDLKYHLKERNVLLIYENSYEGDKDGIKKFYFNDSAESMNYYVEIFSISDKINGFNVILTSNSLTSENFYKKIQGTILPVVEKSAVYLNFDDKIHYQKNDGVSSDGKRWFEYIIKVETMKLLEKQKGN